MRKALALAALVALAGAAAAHEGHEHKVMGKVVAVDEQKIEVESTDGKKVTGALSAETRYLRGKTAVTRADVKAGERVVIVVVEDKNKVQSVKQVLLGVTPPAQQKP
jgi:hypothetical protein